MPDRVKEAVFNILGAYYGTSGALPALCVADVFAGSGSMGLEALSRGAARCCFFERHPEALSALRNNLRDLQVGTEATVHTVNAWQRALLAGDGEPFDLVFLDPPYRDSHDTSQTGPVCRYLARLAEYSERRPQVVLHHAEKVRYAPALPDRWRIRDARLIGSNAITFFTCDGSEDT